MSCDLAVLRELELKGMPGDQDFQVWVDAALQEHAVSVAIRIVGEAQSQALNQRYREQNKPTNVLSFPAELPPVVREQMDYPPLGDLVICAPVLQREARAQNKPVLHHWAHLTVHGVLHLRGFDHIKKSDATVMEQQEIDILAGLSVPNPYVAKSG